MREMQCWILQQISSVKYEEVERSVHLSAIKYMDTCTHTRGPLTQRDAGTYPQVFNHGPAATERTGWPKTGQFPVEAGDIDAVEHIFLAFKPVFYFVYTTKLLC